MVSGTTFTVTVTRKEIVEAVLPQQQHWLPLSNLDLLLPPVHFHVFFCYHNPKPDHPFASIVAVLKTALAQTLVSYYAFAAELVQNCNGEPELLCNNNGVQFYEAFAEIELEDLDLYNPDESIEGKFTPNTKNGVFAVQVTELKCGGIVVACKFDHRVADAFSANMFLLSWSEMARSEPISIFPSFRRSLLNPTRPLFVDPSLDNMYALISSFPRPPPQTLTSGHLVSRIYYVEAAELSHLQSLASSGGPKRSKLESFSAFLWQLVAKSEQKSGKNLTNTSNLGIVVDGRSRLSEDGTKLMDTYFGNVLSIPYGSMNLRELIDSPLNLIANEVHKFLGQAGTKQHFLNLINWVEAHRPEPALAKIYAVKSEDVPAVVVSSGQRFPISEVNFGWGRPFFGSYHFPWGGKAGYVMPMCSPNREGDWIVYMHLFEEQIEVIEDAGQKVFRPLSHEYLFSF